MLSSIYIVVWRKYMSINSEDQICRKLAAWHQLLQMLLHSVAHPWCIKSEKVLVSFNIHTIYSFCQLVWSKHGRATKQEDLKKPPVQNTTYLFGSRHSYSLAERETERARAFQTETIDIMVPRLMVRDDIQWKWVVLIMIIMMLIMKLTLVMIGTTFMMTGKEHLKSFEYVGGNSDEAAINDRLLVTRLVMIEVKQSYTVMLFLIFGIFWDGVLMIMMKNRRILTCRCVDMGFHNVIQ